MNINKSPGMSEFLYTPMEAGADLNLTAREGGHCYAQSTQQICLGRGFVTRHPAYVKSLKQNNMPVFVFSSKFIYYIVILQISSNLFLNGQNVSDSTSVNTDYCLIIT